jgi:hypothetical protein
MTTALARACLLPLALLLVGCPPPPAPACAEMDAGLELQIGSGDPSNPTSFTPLREGDTVALTPGNQGGQHIWVQLRAQHLCTVAPFARVRVVRVSDGMRVGLSIFDGNRWEEVPGEPGLRRSATLAAAIDEAYFCSLLDHGEVRLEVEVRDSMGATVSRSLPLRIHGWSPDSSSVDRASREACCANVLDTRCHPAGPPPDAELTDAAAEQ